MLGLLSEDDLESILGFCLQSQLLTCLFHLLLGCRSSRRQCTPPRKSSEQPVHRNNNDNNTQYT